jgi:hypothetical protein
LSTLGVIISTQSTSGPPPYRLGLREPLGRVDVGVRERPRVPGRAEPDRHRHQQAGDEQHDDRSTPAQPGELDEQQILHR